MNVERFEMDDRGFRVDSRDTPQDEGTECDKRQKNDCEGCFEVIDFEKWCHGRLLDLFQCEISLSLSVGEIPHSEVWLHGLQMGYNLNR